MRRGVRGVMERRCRADPRAPLGPSVIVIVTSFTGRLAGVPEHVHSAADVRLVIPMRGGMRSLNVAMAAAMAVGEAIRQIGNAR